MEKRYLSLYFAGNKKARGLILPRASFDLFHSASGRIISVFQHQSPERLARMMVMMVTLNINHSILT